MPTIAVQAAEDQSALHAALRGLETYDWLVFTSRNAVRVVLGEAASMGIRFPPSLLVAAVGPQTADRLRDGGVDVACVPQETTAEALADALIQRGVTGLRVLLPAGNLARPELPAALLRAGADVTVVTVYRTSLPGAEEGKLAALLNGGIDVVALASPSAFKGLVTMLGQNAPTLRRVRLVCIGPTTARAVREAGFEPAAVADPHTQEGLADAIAKLGLTGTRDDEG